MIIGNIIPAGYSIKQVPRTTQKRGGGITLLYKTGFNVRLTDTGLLPRSFEFLLAEFIPAFDHSVSSTAEIYMLHFQRIS